MASHSVLDNIKANLVVTDRYVNDRHHLIIFGASGDLATKKVYPSLWMLYRKSLLPADTRFIGYARSDLNMEKLSSNIKPHCKINTEEDKELFKVFVSKNSYHRGSYDKPEDFAVLNKYLINLQDGATILYESVCKLISGFCRPQHPQLSWIRIVIEKPFGHDLFSSDLLESQIKRHLTETEIYRIDHYLGKEMVQSLMMLRFANMIFSRVWNKDSIGCVLITFKENIGTLGRGGYFDQFGIIRDVMQNHILQIMAVVAMEPPVSLDADDIRTEKVKVLKSVRPIDFANIVVGQYVGNQDGKTADERTSYLDDPTVTNKSSNTPTFAMAVIYIDNERWSGVPFILKCGKALNERKTEVRVQFRAAPTGQIFSCEHVSDPGPLSTCYSARDELVVRVQPDEAIYLKINNKKPGWDFVSEQSELDLTYHERYEDFADLPEAYERLILDVFSGSQSNFVRSDELHEAWRIFTPLLNHVKHTKPMKYQFGVRTLEGADDLCKKVGFHYSEAYKWPGKRSGSMRTYQL